jgi:GNAT superfamily N-acetyltransferase
MTDLVLEHVERMSSRPDVQKFAQQINKSFLKTHLTELPKLDSEWEAVLLRDGADIVAITVFYRYDDLDGKGTYYLPVVWTTKLQRGHGCYGRMIDWLKEYARKKGARRISTDVHWDNDGMIRLKEKHWKKTFVRFNLEL